MEREISDLECRQTCDLVPYSDVPRGTLVAPGKWGFAEKNCPESKNSDPDSVLRKARWVVCGNRLDKSRTHET